LYLRFLVPLDRQMHQLYGHTAPVAPVADLVRLTAGLGLRLRLGLGLGIGPP